MWQKEYEAMDRAELKALQSKRLRETIERVYNNVAPYRAKMVEMGVKPEHIKSVDDLHLLPFTCKQDLRDNYPYGLFATPLSDVVRIHATSGTTGKQTVVGYTRDDLKVWGDVMARTFAAGGVTKDDIAHVSYGYGLFTGGLGAHGGAETIGCTTVPVSTGNTKRQIQILQDFGCTFICCTPSYALIMAETMAEMGVDPASLKLKVGFFGAEPWTESMRRDIENKLKIQTRDIYGLSEMIGPGVSFECESHCGLHVNEDHFIPEIIDPDTGEVLPEGEQGELVFTCVTKQAMPLIRYRTRDITRLHYEKCTCGRTLARMEKTVGRSDDMLIIRGVNVFPSQIETVLLSFAEVAPYYQIVVDRINNADKLEVQLELGENKYPDSVSELEALRGSIGRAIESAIGISVKVTIAEPKTLPRFEGKAKHVVDKRVLY